MTIVGAVVVGLCLAAIVLAIVELTRTRADPIVWAIFLVAIAQLITELSRLG